MFPEELFAEFLPDLIGLGIDCMICAVIYKAYSRTSHLISAINKAPKIDLDETDLKSFLETHPKTGISDDGKFLPYVAVSGKVSADKGAKLLVNNTFGQSATPKVYGVIKESSIIEHKRSLSRLGFWYDSTRTLHTFTNDLPFWLIPMSKSSVRDAKANLVEVKEWNRASRIDMDVVSDQFESASGSLSDHIFGFIVGDRPKGIQTTEKMLRDGTSMTAIGQLVQSPQGKFKILQPENGLDYLLVKDSIKVLVEDLNSQRRLFRFFLFVFGGVGVFIAGFAGYRYWNRQREARRQDENYRILDEIAQERPRREVVDRPQPDDSEDTPNQQNCVVCFLQPKEVIFLDCGHVCACTDCTRSIMSTNPVCPICRTTIIRVSRAYIS